MSQPHRKAQSGQLAASLLATVLGVLLLVTVAPEASGAVRGAAVVGGLLLELVGVGMLGALVARSRTGGRRS
ncbi:hypothetical protein [Kitasatospora sp. NPDC127116]|uniref:hypothetical protein n=1 Tax=Kitasatospora sp. NPDC127116 TaxID=3345367 RepID=UPI00363611AA